MPPRKKTANVAASAATDGATDAPAPARSTRSSARIRDAASVAASNSALDVSPTVASGNTASGAKPKADPKVPKAKAPTSKAKGKGKKRTRDDNEVDDAEDEPLAKKNKALDTMDEAEEDEKAEPPKQMVIRFFLLSLQIIYL